MSGEKLDSKRQSDEIELPGQGLYSFRQKTDSSGSFALGLYIFAFIVIVIVTLSHNAHYLVYNPVDSYGRVCDRGRLAGKKYLVVFDPTQCAKIGPAVDLVGCATRLKCSKACPRMRHHKTMSVSFANTFEWTFSSNRYRKNVIKNRFPATVRMSSPDDKICTMNRMLYDFPAYESVDLFWFHRMMTNNKHSYLSQEMSGMDFFKRYYYRRRIALNRIKVLWRNFITISVILVGGMLLSFAWVGFTIISFYALFKLTCGLTLSILFGTIVYLSALIVQAPYESIPSILNFDFPHYFTQGKSRLYPFLYLTLIIFVYDLTIILQHTSKLRSVSDTYRTITKMIANRFRSLAMLCVTYVCSIILAIAGVYFASLALTVMDYHFVNTVITNNSSRIYMNEQRLHIPYTTFYYSQNLSMPLENVYNSSACVQSQAVERGDCHFLYFSVSLYGYVIATALGFLCTLIVFVFTDVMRITTADEISLWHVKYNLIKQYSFRSNLKRYVKVLYHHVGSAVIGSLLLFCLSPLKFLFLLFSDLKGSNNLFLQQYNFGVYSMIGHYRDSLSNCARLNHLIQTKAPHLFHPIVVLEVYILNARILICMLVCYFTYTKSPEASSDAITIALICTGITFVTSNISFAMLHSYVSTMFYHIFERLIDEKPITLTDETITFEMYMAMKSIKEIVHEDNL